MKAVKTLLKIVLWTVVVVVAVLLLHPLWLGPTVKCAANTAVPKVTKTGFNLGEFGLNLYTGQVRLGDMQLQNPERFFKERESSAKNPADVKGDGILSTVVAQAGNAVAAAGDAVAAVGDALASSETNAVSFSSISVDFSTLSALTDKIHIKEIAIADLSFYGDLTFSNIREIAENASGGESEAKESKPSSEPEPEKKEEGKDGGKKVVIDRVFITGAKLQWGHVAVPLPDIEIKDIGKDGDAGASEEGACKAIFDGICDAADAVCKGAGSALKLAVEGAGAAADAVGAVVGTVGDAAGAVAETVSNAADAAVETVGNVTGAAVETVGDAAGAVADTVGGATGAATDAVKGATGAATDAVKGAAGAATDAVKDAAGAATDAMKGAAGAVKGLFN